MEQTPIKSENNLSYSTYATANTTTPECKNNNEDDDLIHTLTGMKIGEGSNLHNNDDSIPLLKTKRTFDHQTIEGSPYVTGALPKRFDIHPTPAKDHFLQIQSSALNINSPEIASPPPPPPPPTPLLEQCTNTPNTNTTNIAAQFPVMVFTSASDDHDTGEHQENALRTALLSGENGCLRRGNVKEAIEWIDCEHLPLPPIADLLRLVTNSFFFISKLYFYLTECMSMSIWLI